MRLIVTIPAYNEEERLGGTIARIPRSFPGVDEVLVQVVDDGSRDRTSEVARQAGADLVITHGTNRGLGRAFRTAVEAALENGADLMAFIDADGQFDPKDIGTLMQPVLKGEADLVSADRFGATQAKNMPWIKNALNRLAASLIGSFMNTKINDLTCGFRVYSRETLLRLNLLGDFTYTQEVIIDALGKNLKVKWIPVEVTYFADRKSRMVKSVYKYINNSARIIMKAVRDVRPMKFFGIPGVVLMLASLGLFIVFFSLYFGDGFKISPYRNYLFAAVASFIIGLQFFVFSLIADMVKSNRKLMEDQLYLMRKRRYDRDGDRRD